jgi:hypothetical protein
LNYNKEPNLKEEFITTYAKESPESFIERTKKNRTGKLMSYKDISRRGKYYMTIESMTLLKEENTQKIYFIERMSVTSQEGQTSDMIDKTGKIYLRYGYYIVGQNGNKKGKYIFGQYCPTIEEKEDKLLRTLAIKEGTIKF